MKKKFLGFIETKPFILFHYLPLIFVIFLAGFSFNQFISPYVLNNTYIYWVSAIAWYYVFLLVGDQLIHYLGGQY